MLSSPKFTQPIVDTPQTITVIRRELLQQQAATSLSEALRHIRQGHGVDLLITDYHLEGGETGTQVIAALRELLGHSFKAVLATGDTSTAIKQLPRDPYLRITSKPIRADELLTLLRGLLAG